jgi:hypothetical protein
MAVKKKDRWRPTQAPECTCKSKLKKACPKHGNEKFFKAYGAKKVGKDTSAA